VFKGAGPVVGVTSLSLATVAVHASQEGTSDNNDSPANALPALILWMAAQGLLL